MHHLLLQIMTALMSQVHFDSTRIGARDVIAAITDQGFKATLASDDNLEMVMH